MELFNIADGVEGLFIKNNRFSTTQVSVNFYLPLKKESIAVNALLPFVLTSCCAKYPDFAALNLKLCELYGTQLGALSDKIGDVQLIKMFSFCINNNLTPDNMQVVENAVDLLYSMLFEPLVKGEEFSVYDLERERRLTLEKIEGIINDKRTYAISKTIAEMYKDEAFGELKSGSAEAVKSITANRLYNAWKNMLKTAKIRIQVVGPNLPEGIFERFKNQLSRIERTPVIPPKTVAKSHTGEVRYIEEPMEVTQGKLVMGFCAPKIVKGEESAAVAIFADIFGGGPYSKLFTNVREKLSLCYYCAARANRSKGYLLVDSGVENQNIKKAEKEITNQLNMIKKGEFDDEVLEASKRSITDSLACFNDSGAALDGWYSLKVNKITSPEEFAKNINSITKEQVIEVANMYVPDIVYCITPKGEEE